MTWKRSYYGRLVVAEVHFVFEPPVSEAGKGGKTTGVRCFASRSNSGWLKAFKLSSVEHDTK